MSIKVLDFISMDWPTIDVEAEDINDLEALIRGEDNFDETPTPSVERPVTMDANDISRIVPSVYNSKWTDVYLKDGDLLVAQMEYLNFKIKWFEALGVLAQQTFQDLSSLDEQMNFRVYKN